MKPFKLNFREGLTKHKENPRDTAPLKSDVTFVTGIGTYD